MRSTLNYANKSRLLALLFFLKSLYLDSPELAHMMDIKRILGADLSFVQSNFTLYYVRYLYLFFSRYQNVTLPYLLRDSYVIFLEMSFTQLHCIDILVGLDDTH
jgi:hypothetical protein